MSTHKATAARRLSYHQAASGQPAIRALATAPLRRLALSVLFTIATYSYQTTCTISERTFNKRQHANARHGVDFSLFTHYDMVAAQTQPWRRNHMDVSQCQLLEKTASEGKAAKAARLFRPPAAPAWGKGLGPDQCRGVLGWCGKIVLITYGEGGQDNCIQGTIIASTAEPSGINWQPHGDKECFSGRERALHKGQWVSNLLH